MAQPHIIFIMTDQQCWDTLGCYGYEHMQTPHIDPLSARGQLEQTLLVFTFDHGDCLSDHGPLHGVVFSEHGPRVMSRTHEWKLVFYPCQPYGELYDLRSEHGELNNLYDVLQHGDAQRQMVEHVLHWYPCTRMRRAG